MATARRQLGYVSSLTTQDVPLAASSIPTIVQFTTTGTNNYTVPAGVSYIVANIQGAGGGTRVGATDAGNGGDSSVAFAAGTITATGGNKAGPSNTLYATTVMTNLTPNQYGIGGLTIFSDQTVPANGGNRTVVHNGGRGAFIRCGGAVTAGNTLVVTVGAGGTAGTSGAAGSQGIVTLELYASNNRRVELFTSSGTFTPPSGVTKVMATIVGGGAGIGSSADGLGTDGGSSSVAFSGGTITATGGQAANITRVGYDSVNYYVSGVANSGDGSWACYVSNGAGVFNDWGAWGSSTNGRRVTVSGTVTPAVGISVTVGASGNDYGVSASGATGVVWIEYDV
jgi:hypothetical protein